MTVLVQGTTEMTLTVLNEGSTAVAETCRVSTLWDPHRAIPIKNIAPLNNDASRMLSLQMYQKDVKWILTVVQVDHLLTTGWNN